MVSLCKLFGVTKQAFYKYVDHSTDSSARERFVLEFVKRVRSKDPGIGGMKLWLMYRNEFGTSQAFVGRDCFCAILSKYANVFGLHVRQTPLITCHSILI